MIGMRILLLAVLALLAAPPAAPAQAPPGGSPIYHGLLDIVPSHGTIDRNTDLGVSTLRVRRWRYIIAQNTNGLVPDRERLLIALGSGDNDFYLPPGSLESKRKGKVFVYHAPRGATGRVIRSFRLVSLPDGTYRVSFQLEGVELASLFFENPACLACAVIIGDDDGFAIVDIGTKNFHSRRLTIRTGTCTASWPWLGS